MRKISYNIEWKNCVSRTIPFVKDQPRVNSLVDRPWFIFCKFLFNIDVVMTKTV